MGIKDRLTDIGTSFSRGNGATPSSPDLKGSKVHYTYSIDGNPNLVGYPKPSLLDLNGITPPKYIEQVIEK